MGFDDIDKKFRPKEIKLECSECQSVTGVELEDSRTQYPYSGTAGDPDDPNRKRPMCRECAKRHHEYWDEAWSSYYAGFVS